MYQKDACNTALLQSKNKLHPKNIRLFSKNNENNDDLLTEFDEIPQFIFDQYSNTENKEKIKIVDTSKLKQKSKNKLF